MIAACISTQKTGATRDCAAPGEDRHAPADDRRAHGGDRSAPVDRRSASGDERGVPIAVAGCGLGLPRGDSAAAVCVEIASTRATSLSDFPDMLEIQVDRGDGKGWVFLTYDTTPNYTDTFPLPSTPTKWKYRAIYQVGDSQVGKGSNEMSITVGG
jgi:hypothetical protein